MTRFMSQLWQMMQHFVAIIVNFEKIRRTITGAMLRQHQLRPVHHSASIDSRGHRANTHRRQVWRRISARHFRPHRVSHVRMHAVGAV